MSILKLLPGTARIKAGEILFGGMDLSKMTPHQLRKVRGNRISIVFQTPCPAWNLLPVGEQVGRCCGSTTRP